MTSFNNTPSVQYLQEAIAYYPETGEMFWRERPPSHFLAPRYCRSFNTRFAGKPAGSMNETGYMQVCVDGRIILSHRVAYAIFHGEWPDGEVDHWNGKTDDNRISNLRDVSRSRNARNSRMWSHNKSGVNGVFWQTGISRWVARIEHKGVKRHLGQFRSFEGAVKARKDAELGLGFTKRHGKRQEKQ